MINFYSPRRRVYSIQTEPLYLRTTIPLAPGRTYRVIFRYKILLEPDRGFEVLFFSPTAAAAGSFLPSVRITGAAGSTGTTTLTNTLEPYQDYHARGM